MKMQWYLQLYFIFVGKSRLNYFYRRSKQYWLYHVFCCFIAYRTVPNKNIQGHASSRHCFSTKSESGLLTRKMLCTIFMDDDEYNLSLENGKYNGTFFFTIYDTKTCTINKSSS